MHELKQLILDGATSGGRTGGSYPLLNAYEALKLAGRRPGAPLCGNRLAADALTLSVQRSTGWESILTLNASRGHLNVLHGGTTLDALLFDASTQQSLRDRYVLQGGTWTASGPAPSDTYPLGTLDGSVYNSQRGTSHSADTTATLAQPGGSFFENFILTVLETSQPSNTYHQHAFQESLTNSNTLHCLRRASSDQSCLEPRFMDEGQKARGGVAWSPATGKVVMWLTRGSETLTFGPWVDCLGGSECRDHETVGVFDHTDLYEVDVPTGNRRLLFSVPFAAQVVAVSEDGSEVMVPRLHQLTTSTGQWQYSEVPGPFGFPIVERNLVPYVHDLYTSCAVEWRDYETGTLLATSPFDKTCLDSSTNHDSWYMGTLAP